MAAEGHSAREIAERLFISKRTVESHLGKVYAKLGVGSKPRLAARAEEFPL
jgi:DNA-binding CsgD family transcriptional regulator